MAASRTVSGHSSLGIQKSARWLQIQYCSWHASLVFRIAVVFGCRRVGVFKVFSSAAQVGLGFCDRPASVVLRIGFFDSAIVRNASDYDFGIVAPRECPLGVGPIAFGLAFVIGWDARRSSFGCRVSNRFRRSVMNGELTNLVYRIAFLPGSHDELVGKFLIRESGQPKYPRCVRCSEVAAELVREAVQQGFGFIDRKSAHFPHNLVFPRRGIEDEVGRRNVGRIPDRFESSVSPGQDPGTRGGSF